MIAINWQRICPLDGSQKAAFEELCAQLARSEHPVGFIRKGAPDAGVECFVVRDDGSEWAWQAKFFDSLGDSQWGQLDESVKTALDKHPKLGRYYVCVPCDRPDARIQGQSSALDKWNAHVSKWQGWAVTRNMTVEFEYWGSSELLDRLHKPEHAGKVLFWFGVAAFDRPWFAKRLQESIDAAGPRYTPEVHIDLPIAREFEAFGRTPKSVGAAKSLAIEIRKRFGALRPGRRQLSPRFTDLMTGFGRVMGEALDGFGGLSIAPDAVPPFRALAGIVQKAQQECEPLADAFKVLAEEFDPDPKTNKRTQDALEDRTNPYREKQGEVWPLSKSLRVASSSLLHLANLAESKILILKGLAGTGKTHLMCDVAKGRVAAGMPTVLLMGQRFTTTEEPWTQALSLIDQPNATVEEFVGALEAAAQAADCRALVMIDAINEGAGRQVWHDHLEAFLAHLERSPWIGTVLSVRTSYEEHLIPERIIERAARIEHVGFYGQEYDALKEYFRWYGLEMPSTPLLDPEFSNPLFLKTLCKGLSGLGHRRLPRGYHGITSVFNLYIEAVQKKLSEQLDFNPRAPKVRQAIDLFAKRLAESGERWMRQSEAEDVVNGVLPGRDFSRSLYRGLIDEGILAQEVRFGAGTDGEESVYISYERLADHLVVKTTLDEHLVPSDPAAAFAPGGALAYLTEDSYYPPQGVLEALSIQIPERCGKEFAQLEPRLISKWGMDQAFRQSIVWRKPDAFNDETLPTLNTLIRSHSAFDAITDALLTVATIPGHQLNAKFLDARFRRDSMPERDAWWSLYVHRAWRQRGALYRIIDWAWELSPESDVEDEVVDLTATILAWVFTTSNRYARDRATKALVSLLSGRLTRTAELVRNFADVDDSYVLERVYATAYGVAMRCHDGPGIAHLAKVVYESVFASGSPPAHILLRDYARGVVERALFLGAELQIDENLIRPPYGSVWPPIPTEEDIKQLALDTDLPSVEDEDEQRDYEEKGFGRSRIFGSVEHDDFGRYVIGTNGHHTDWLSLGIDEPTWRPRKDELAELIGDLSPEERTAWDKNKETHKALFGSLTEDQLNKVHIALSARKEGEESDENDGASKPDPEIGLIIEKINEGWIAADAALQAVLTEEHATQLRKVLNRPRDDSQRHGPRFDLSIIQRYVIWRVFDLGWTSKRFDEFDGRTIGYDGRSPNKAERIGKKYQWIAYHEIMALIADHFQFLEEMGNDPAVDRYHGPWQDGLRDIDPSCGLKKPVGGTGYDGHDPAWWAPVEYSGWAEESEREAWAMNTLDLLDPSGLLSNIDPSTGVRWLNLDGYFRWRQEGPEDRDSSDVDHQGIRYNCDAFLVKAQEVDQFVAWAKGINFEMSRMPDAPEVYRIFLGEHPWAPAADFMRRPWEGEQGWTEPAYNCPVEVRVPTFHYMKEQSGFDCSVDDTYVLRMPAWDLLKGLELHWNGKDADYVDSEGSVVAFDPTARFKGPTALLMREDAMRDFLAKEGLALCWTISGEKRLFLRNYGKTRPKWVSVTGIYRLTPTGIEGHYSGAVER